MTGSAKSAEPSFTIIPGSGSAGFVWNQVAGAIQAKILPLPDACEVGSMVETLRTELRSQERPRVLIGTSLGALVALELARETTVDVLVLMSAGFGVTVSSAVLATLEENQPDMLTRMARGVVARPEDDEMIEAIVADFQARGPAVLLRHLRALRDYEPLPLERQPPTFVIWGTEDPGVPLLDHVELAIRCGAPLLPIPDAGHMPYVEQPEQTLNWIAAVVSWTLCSKTLDVPLAN